jgi:hypothetical protein
MFLTEHTNMLDCEKKQQPYTEDQMRHLVDSEYNVLMLLVSAFQKDVSGNHSFLIESIFLLMNMLTASLLKFDQIYYYNNLHLLENESPWHLAHDKWMRSYDMLRQDWFIEKLQDYCILEVNMNTMEMDLYCSELEKHVIDAKEQIEDNQALIVAFGNMESLEQFHNFTSKQVKDALETAFREAETDFDKATVEDALKSTLQLAALA